MTHMHVFSDVWTRKVNQHCWARNFSLFFVFALLLTSLRPVLGNVFLKFADKLRPRKHIRVGFGINFLEFNCLKCLAVLDSRYISSHKLFVLQHVFNWIYIVIVSLFWFQGRLWLLNHLDFLLRIHKVDFRVDKAFFQEDVHEPACLVVWSISNFTKLYLLYAVVLGQILNDCFSHILARFKPERSLFFVLVEELHGTWTLIVSCLRCWFDLKGIL